MRRLFPVLALLISVISQTLAITYTVHDLGLLPGAKTTWAHAINDRGEIVGWAEMPSGLRYPVYWSQDGQISRIGNLSGYNARGEGINSSGQIAGHASYGGFFFDPLAGVRQYSGGGCTAINDAGWHVGNRNRKASLWYPDGTFLELGSLPGHLYSMAYGINNEGVVVGESYTDYFLAKAFLWTSDRGMEDLHGLGGRWTYAYDINNKGQVVGRSRTTSYQYEDHACLWEADGSITDLSAISGQYTDHSGAQAINEWGTIVGQSSYVAAVWEADTHKLVKLPLLPGFTGGETIDINNRGMIVGYCSHYLSEPHYSHAALWVPMIRQIQIDIKPGESPNKVNLDSKGRLPVAILGTAEFDATSVDPATIRLAVAQPIRWHSEDVNADGLLDLMLHFQTSDLAISIVDTEVKLTGQTLAGEDIEGVDSIIPVHAGK
ncbi:MAG TPA: hypothetical protein VFI02_21035 [Armatimonadota bacterium]|nr:hypothetical protein [Armatimonadota bacterium]